MTEAIGHDKLVNRYRLSGTLVCQTALHVGSGSAPQTGVQASDLPVALDGRGLPYVPGSSFRGAFRSALEALLRGLDRPGLRVCNPFEIGKEAQDRSCAERAHARREVAKDQQVEMTEREAFELAWEESCAICRLFGQLFLASRVRVADLPLLSQPRNAKPYVRNGVGIDRDLRTAAKNILYDFEAVPAGSEFALRIDIDNANNHEVGLILSGLEMLGDGLFTLGGKSARGLGLVKVEGTTLTRWRAKDFFDGGQVAPLAGEELEALRQAARTHYVAEGGA